MPSTLGLFAFCSLFCPYSDPLSNDPSALTLLAVVGYLEYAGVHAKSPAFWLAAPKHRRAAWLLLYSQLHFARPATIGLEYH